MPIGKEGIQTSYLHVQLPREVRERARIQQERDGVRRVDDWIEQVLTFYCDKKRTPSVRVEVVD